MKTIKLNNGVEMPILGFGVYQVEPVQTERVVLDALEVGYRSLDTAAAYNNEEEVGRAISRSGIAREEIFLTTKLWIRDAGYDNAMKAFETSLKKLGTDYLDLYLIHQPFGDYYGSWRAMEELYKDGRIKAIGVSNFMPDRLIDLISHNEIVPAVNQVETNPFHQQTQAHAIMDEYGVQIESWAPFAEGRNNLFTNETLTGVASRIGKTVGQVVLRWLIQKNVVVIPKSVRRERMQENFEVFGFELSDTDMAEIARLDMGQSQFFSHYDPETVKWLTNA